jgi:hypothetical protein
MERNVFERAVRAVVLFTVLVAGGAACTSMRALPASPPSAEAFGGVKVGDTVSLEMNDGSRAQFVIARIEEDQLVSPEGERSARSRPVSLRRSLPPSSC